MWLAQVVVLSQNLELGIFDESIPGDFFGLKF